MSSTRSKPTKRYAPPTANALHLLKLMRKYKAFAAVAGVTGELAGIFTSDVKLLYRFPANQLSELVASGFVTEVKPRGRWNLRRAAFDTYLLNTGQKP